MLPDIKVYKINYEFIINNYLDKSLWKKDWHIYEYMGMLFTLSLRTIDVYDDSISFSVKLNGSSLSNTFWYYLKNSNINVLKKQITGAIFDIMCRYEENAIKNTTRYLHFSEVENAENDRLKDIACDFLDSEGVTNRDIRDVYIDNYVSKNNKTYELKMAYLDGCKYNLYPNMFLTFTKAIGDENRERIIKSHIKDKDKIIEIEKKLERHEEYFNSDNYDEDMNNELESV